MIFNYDSFLIMIFNYDYFWIMVFNYDSSLIIILNYDSLRFWKVYNYGFEVEWNLIELTVFISAMNQNKFWLVHNQKENCNYDHIPSCLKGISNLFFSVYTQKSKFWILSNQPHSDCIYNLTIDLERNGLFHYCTK